MRSPMVATRLFVGIVAVAVMIASAHLIVRAQNLAQERESQSQTFRVVPLNGLTQPWALAFLPSGDILVTERRGTLRIVRNWVLDPTPFGGIPEVATGSLKGLMDIAPHPRFAENHLVYFTYTKRTQPGQKTTGTSALARGRYEGGTTLVDVRDIFVADAESVAAEVSRIIFAPDGKIFMSIGSPGRRKGAKYTADDAQNPANHIGKILRLNDDGTAPSDNPFFGRTGYRQEIYAIGVRSCVGLAIHPTTGQLFATDNGPFGGDEINIIAPGKNYGWPVISLGRAYTGEKSWDAKTGFDGPGALSGVSSDQLSAAGMESPWLAWDPSIAVAGLLFYTGDRFPLWKGHLFVAALGGNAGYWRQLVQVVLNDRQLPVARRPLLREINQRLRDIKQGPDGLVYLTVAETSADDSPGSLLRLEPVGSGR